MGRSESPPFDRGSSYFNGDVIESLSDLTNIGGEGYEGREYDVEDTRYGTGATVTLRVVRNMSATPVKPGLAYARDTSGFTLSGWNGRVNGLATVLGTPSLIADDHTPTQGVPQYDLFYAIVDGPVAVHQPAVVTTALAIGSIVQADASGNGTVVVADFSGVGATLAANVINRVGTVIGGLAGTTTTSQANGNPVISVFDIDD